MPWRNLPEWISNAPEVVKWVLGFLTLIGAAGVGTLAKIADDVKRGDRDRFWTKKLFLEVPAVGMMALIGYGVTEFFDLSLGSAVAVGSFLGWAGPRTIEVIISARLLYGRR